MKLTLGKVVWYVNCDEYNKWQVTNCYVVNINTYLFRYRKIDYGLKKICDSKVIRGKTVKKTTYYSNDWIELVPSLCFSSEKMARFILGKINDIKTKQDKELFNIDPAEKQRITSAMKVIEANAKITDEMIIVWDKKISRTVKKWEIEYNRS